MANITPTSVEKSGDTTLTTWEAITTTDHTGDGFSNPGAPDRTVQAFGTWDGATLIIEGSNDGTNWSQCYDAAGDLFSLTADGIKALRENPLFIRPRLSVVGSSADVDVLMLSRSMMG